MHDREMVVNKAELRRRWLVVSSKAGAELQILVALAALTGYFVLAHNAAFASTTNLTNISREAAILLVVTIGQMFALLVGGFDLSVAANMGLASTVSALSMTRGHTVGYAVAAGLLCSALVGLVNGLLISRLRISPFVATLGTLTFLGGLSNHLADGASISGLVPSFSTYFGQGDWGPIPSAVGIAGFVLVLAWLVSARSRLGLHIFAVGGGREASRLAGLRVSLVEVAAYGLCGTLAGIAGLMLSARVGIGQASLGQGYDLLSIAAAVVGGVAIGGGVGRLWGVVLGVAMLTVLTTGLDIAAVPEFTQQMVTGAVLVLAVLTAQLRTGGSTAKSAWSALQLVRRRPPAAGLKSPAL